MGESPRMLPEDEHNLKLLGNVRPRDWKNPEPASRYDLVVIGAGTAGLVAAAGAAGLGARVALIERNLFGGECLNTGCVPSKALIRSARAVHDVRKAAEFGVAAGSIATDFGKAMARMRRLRAGISVHDAVQRFSRDLNVHVFLGPARFLTKDAVQVEGTLLRFKKAVICTGSRPAAPPIPGLDETGFLTNENIFELTELPRRTAIIGGGPIGSELAQAFARMGSEVTVFEQGAQIFPREDADAAGIVHRALERDGVTVRLRAALTNAAKTGGEKILTWEGDGRREEIPVDEIVVAAGRKPNVEGLGLEQAGIENDARNGVLVNDRLQTSNRNVYAAGDISSSYKFTHAADALSRIVIANALFGARQKASSLVIPWCTFTDPEIAHVGMTGKEAGAQGREIASLTVPFAGVDRAVLEGETEGFARVYVTKKKGLIAGATIVGRDAGEMISEITLAMASGLGLPSLAKTIHPYPTRAEAIKKLGDQYNRTRLTPFIKKLLSLWLRWR